MMNYFFVTGTSRGIGKSIVDNLLNDESNYIIGLSRHNTFKHERFEHIRIDLREIESVKNYRFIKIIDANSITLINNSGMIASKHVGNIDNQSIIDVFNVNIIAPFLLVNNFINAYQHISVKKLILNISSGAGRTPMESWSSYCASKSALDMLSQVVFKEQEHFKDPISIKVLSIAPGIVDTQMQEEIRKSDKMDFKMLDTFIKYKDENLLASTDDTAKKLINVMNQSGHFLEPLFDLREL